MRAQLDHAVYPSSDLHSHQKKTLTCQAARAATALTIFSSSPLRPLVVAGVVIYLIVKSANIFADLCTIGCVLGAVAARAAGVM